MLIQGGDPTTSGTGGPGYTTVDTPPVNGTYERGTVAMAKVAGQAPGTAGSTFFVVTAAKAHLHPGAPVIGTVIKGLDVVDRIDTFGGAGDLASQVENTSGLPTKVVEIEHATVATS